MPEDKIMPDFRLSVNRKAGPWRKCVMARMPIVLFNLGGICTLLAPAAVGGEGLVNWPRPAPGGAAGQSHYKFGTVFSHENMGSVVLISNQAYRRPKTICVFDQ